MQPRYRLAASVFHCTMRKNFLQRIVMPALMLFSLSTLMFLYGFLCREYRIFPFHHLNEAHIASSALVEIAQIPSVRLPSDHRVRIDKPTVFQHATTSSSQYIVVSAGAAAKLPGLDQPVMAWVIDRAGHVVHSWKAQPHLWDDLKVVQRVPGISGPVSPAGIHVFPDGSLLATFHGQNTFPFAVGLAKFDRDSNVLWKKEILTHHFFTIDDRGHIWVPGMEVVDSPVTIGHTNAIIETYKGKVYLDQIVELDSNGEELSRIGVLKALCDSGRQGLLTYMNLMRLDNDDPTHLNDVRVISARDTEQLPGTSAGDLLISLRNLNTLAVLDRDTKLIKWCSTGSTIGQHSPRVFQQGILALDNLGGDYSLGGTRIVHIDFATAQPRTLFPKPGVDMPDKCRTTYSGHIDIQADQQYLLAAISNSGAVWEIDLTSGEVVWEYLVSDSFDPTLRACVGYAGYADSLSFLSSQPVAAN